MGYSGMNLESVKAQNRSSILRSLNDHGAMSRKDLSEQLGLTPASVTTLCSELLEEGMLRELGEMSTAKRAGRRKILLDINDRYRYVLSVSIETPTTCVSLCTLRGERLGVKRLQTDSWTPPEVLLRKIADECKLLMWENEIQREQLLGAGVSLPGPVDRQTGTSIHAYRIWEQPVQVVRLLEQWLECPVLLENNVKAFAQAELIFGVGRQQENLLLLKWGPGVGSAIITQNRIYESDTYKTAEIGHVRVEPGGELCRCGRRGCLETRVASHPLVRHLRTVCDPELAPGLWNAAQGNPAKITVHNLDVMAALDDAAVWKILDEDIETLANVVGGFLTMLAPDRLILYGSMFALPHFLEHFLAACRRYDPAYDESYIRMSALNEKIEFIGPLAVVVEELFYHERTI